MNKNLFSDADIKELEKRITSLDKDATPVWGKMNVAQMLAHCSEVLRNALGEVQQKRKLIGYIIAPFIKHRYFDAIPYKKKNVPSSFVVKDERAFNYERKNLIMLIKRFYLEGREKSKDAVHPILGEFTADQWAIGQYKHIDHHLRQFKV